MFVQSLNKYSISQVLLSYKLHTGEKQAARFTSETWPPAVFWNCVPETSKVGERWGALWEWHMALVCVHRPLFDIHEGQTKTDIPKLRLWHLWLFPATSKGQGQSPYILLVSSKIHLLCCMCEIKPSFPCFHFWGFSHLTFTGLERELEQGCRVEENYCLTLTASRSIPTFRPLRVQPDIWERREERF